MCLSSTHQGSFVPEQPHSTCGIAGRCDVPSRLSRNTPHKVVALNTTGTAGTSFTWSRNWTSGRRRVCHRPFAPPPRVVPPRRSAPVRNTPPQQRNPPSMEAVNWPRCQRAIPVTWRHPQPPPKCRRAPPPPPPTLRPPRATPEKDPKAPQDARLAIFQQ
jgi:hypothetical protein